MFDGPQIAIGRVGVYCGCVHVTEPRSWITDNALYISEMSQSLSAGYLAAALKEAALNQYANQAAQPLISGSRVYPVSILVPPMPDQLRFERATGSTAQLQRRAMASGEALDALFASLQQRAFRGEL